MNFELITFLFLIISLIHTNDELIKKSKELAKIKVRLIDRGLGC
jgi:hypothetical protein